MQMKPKHHRFTVGVVYLPSSFVEGYTPLTAFRKKHILLHFIFLSIEKMFTKMSVYNRNSQCHAEVDRQ